jgi:divinyl protochlorophyllide a 8-vinyl-reductase
MPAAAARIGPNAIVQLANALRDAAGDAAVARLFRAANLTRLLAHMPDTMVDEADVVRLHHALLREWPATEARQLARDAGRRTGDYLLGHRIPMPVQRLLRVLPASVAASVLMRAITRHAWTFAGSGRFSAHLPDNTGAPSNAARWLLTIQGNPLCRGLPELDHPACDYYAATFERLIVALVHPRASVVEVTCEASGGDACRFEVGWH